MVTTRQDQERWVARYHESGVSIRAFAREHGLMYHRVVYWVDQARRRRDADGGGQYDIEATVREPAFIHVASREAGPHRCVPPAPRAEDDLMVLSLGRARLTLRSAIDPRYVAALLREAAQ